MTKSLTQCIHQVVFINLYGISLELTVKPMLKIDVIVLLNDEKYIRCQVNTEDSKLCRRRHMTLISDGQIISFACSFHQNVIERKTACLSKNYRHITGDVAFCFVLFFAM